MFSAKDETLLPEEETKISGAAGSLLNAHTPENNRRRTFNSRGRCDSDKLVIGGDLRPFALSRSHCVSLTPQFSGIQS